MAQNRATIYSNGIAELSRIYSVSKSKPAKISIPVRQQHLADVLASLNISGDVKINAPPSFQPANIDDGNLTINSNGSLTSIAEQLSGAQIKIVQGEENISGRLIGLQDQQVGTSGEPYQEKFLVVMCKSSIRRIAIKDVHSMQFTDPVIQAEIEKALSRQLREIKPNSTFVDLELSTLEKKTDAIIQYTIPAAAWKISYRLILLENNIELHGHAIVDNNTDEDWNDFLISVVMGQPITFTSDLADSKTPRRDHVNIVQENAVGAIEVEEHYGEAMVLAGMRQEPLATRGEVRKVGRKAMLAQSAIPAAPRAKIDEATQSDAGEFCLFQSPHPVSIGARRSAIIPVFQTEMKECDTVLHFKEENHPKSAFRSIRFKNNMQHSLGRGICTVFDQSTYAGSCIIPSLKQDEETLLPHALDSGVKFIVKSKQQISRRIGVRISEGVVVETHHLQTQTDYHINNNGDSFPLVLDHSLRLSGSKTEFHLLQENTDPQILETKSLEQGKRVEFDLPEKTQLVVSVIESKTRSSKVFLIKSTSNDDLQTRWLVENLIESNSPYASEPEILRCIELQRELDDIGLQAEHARNEVARLDKRQERLRKNIKAGGGQQQDQRWRTDLAKTEDAIVQLEDERINELNEQRSRVRQQLFDALSSLALQWNE